MIHRQVLQDAGDVRDDQDGFLGASEAVNALGDGAHGVDIKARIRLIQDGQLGVKHLHLEDLVLLFFSAGKAHVEITGGIVLGDAQLRHLRLQGPAEGDQLLRLAHLRVLGRAQEAFHRDAADLLRRLEGKEDAAPGARVCLFFGDVSPFKEDAALGHLIAGIAQDHIGQGGFAGAVRPHQDVDFARVYIKIDAVENALSLNGRVKVSDA